MKHKYDIVIAKALINLSFRDYQIKKLGFHGYTIDKARKRNVVVRDISFSKLQEVAAYLCSKLTSSYYVSKLKDKYSAREISKMLDMSISSVYSILKYLRKKEQKSKLLEIKKDAVKQYRSYKRKKCDIEMILETLKTGYFKGLKHLRLYIHASNIRHALKRYNITKDDIEKYSLNELKHKIVNDFLIKKTNKDLDTLVSILCQRKVTKIGTKEWDRLRNINITKKEMFESSDIRQYLIEKVYSYIRYRQTVLSCNRNKKYYLAKERASSKSKNAVIFSLLEDKTTAGIDGLW